MRKFAEQRPSAYASLPQDKSAPQCMRNSVKQCTGMNVWSSSRLSMSPTQRLSAPQSTRKTVSTNGRVMVMIKYGLLLLELARAIHTKHVLMRQSQKLSRFPTLFAGIFQNRSVLMFPDKIVCRFPTRFAQTSLYKSAKMCQDRHASRFTKKVPNRVSRKVAKKVCQDTGSHLNGVAIGNGPVVIDARKNEKSVQFEEGVETPNSIVFGD